MGNFLRGCWNWFKGNFLLLLVLVAAIGLGVINYQKTDSLAEKLFSAPKTEAAVGLNSDDLKPITEAINKGAIGLTRELDQKINDGLSRLESNWDTRYERVEKSINELLSRPVLRQPADQPVLQPVAPAPLALPGSGHTPLSVATDPILVIERDGNFRYNPPPRVSITGQLTEDWQVEVLNQMVQEDLNQPTALIRQPADRQPISETLTAPVAIEESYGAQCVGCGRFFQPSQPHSHCPHHASPSSRGGWRLPRFRLPQLW